MKSPSRKEESNYEESKSEYCEKSEDENIVQKVKYILFGLELG